MPQKFQITTPDGRKVTLDLNGMPSQEELDKFFKGSKEHPIYSMSDLPKDWRPADEARFKHWYARVSKEYHLDPNPDDPEHHYNYRMAFKNGAWPNAEGHWPSRYKDALHPNRFVDGKDTTQDEEPKKAGGGMLRVHKSIDDYTEQDLSLLPIKDAERIRARQAANDTFGGQLSSGKKKLDPLAILATPQSSIARGIGSLLDQPASATTSERDKGFLSSVVGGLASGPFGDITTPSHELESRGVDLPAGAGMLADVALDPLMYAGAELFKPFNPSITRAGVRQAANLALTHGVPAAAGAVIDEEHPLRGAIIGGTLGHLGTLATKNAPVLDLTARAAAEPKMLAEPGVVDMVRGADGNWYMPGASRPAPDAVLNVPRDTAFTAEFGSPEQVRAARIDSAAASPAGRPVVLNPDEPINAMQDIGGSYLRYQAEDPLALRKAEEMRESGLQAKEALNDTHKGRGGGQLAEVGTPEPPAAAAPEEPLFADETAQPQEKLTAPRFKGWQEVLEGEPPVALYDWPIDESGRFTTGTATDLRKAGHEVPEPTFGPPNAGNWTSTSDLMPEQLETLQRYSTPAEPAPVPSQPAAAEPAASQVETAPATGINAPFTPEEAANYAQVYGTEIPEHMVSEAPVPPEDQWLHDLFSGKPEPQLTPEQLREQEIAARRGIDRMRPKAEAILPEVKKPTNVNRIKSLLQKHGVGQAERELTQIDQWLDSKNGGTVTPEELAEAIETGRKRLIESAYRDHNAKWANYQAEQLVVPGPRQNDFEFVMKVPEAPREAVPEVQWESSAKQRIGHDEARHRVDYGVYMGGAPTVHGLAGKNPVTGETYAAMIQDFREPMTREGIEARIGRQRDAMVESLDKLKNWMAQNIDADPVVVRYMEPGDDPHMMENKVQKLIDDIKAGPPTQDMEQLIDRDLPSSKRHAFGMTGVPDELKTELRQRLMDWRETRDDFKTAGYQQLEDAQAKLDDAISAMQPLEDQTLDKEAIKGVTDKYIQGLIAPNPDNRLPMGFTDMMRELGDLGLSDRQVSALAEMAGDVESAVGTVKRRQDRRVVLSSPSIGTEYFATPEAAEHHFKTRIATNLKNLAENRAYSEMYKSPHWSNEPNMFMHGRTNSREIDGVRTRFIEELQSDPHQTARETPTDEDFEPTGPPKGYRTPERKAEHEALGRRIEELNQEVIDDARALSKDYARLVGELPEYTADRMKPDMGPVDAQNASREMARNAMYAARTEKRIPEEAAQQIQDRADAIVNKALSRGPIAEQQKALGYLNAIPNLPLKETSQWVGMGMMRSLAEAIDKGEKAIAWTTGQQQHERYGKVLENIRTLEKDSDGIKWDGNELSDEQISEIRKLLKQAGDEDGLEAFDRWRKLPARDASDAPFVVDEVEQEPQIEYQIVDHNGHFQESYDSEREAYRALDRDYGGGSYGVEEVRDWEIRNADGEVIEKFIGTEGEADKALKRVTKNHGQEGDTKRTFSVEDVTPEDADERWALTDHEGDRIYGDDQLYGSEREAERASVHEDPLFSVTEVESEPESEWRVYDTDNGEYLDDEYHDSERSAERARDRAAEEWANEHGGNNFAFAKPLTVRSRGFDFAYDEVAVNRMKKFGKKYGVQPELKPLENWTVEHRPMEPEAKAELEFSFKSAEARIKAAETMLNESRQAVADLVERLGPMNYNELRNNMDYRKATSLVDVAERALIAAKNDRRNFGQQLAEAEKEWFASPTHGMSQKDATFKSQEAAEAYARDNENQRGNQVWFMPIPEKMADDIKRDGLPLMSDLFGFSALNFAKRFPHLAAVTAGAALGANVDEDHPIRGAILGALGGAAAAELLKNPARLRYALKDESGVLLPETRRAVAESPGFKRWFKGSKVVDSDGMPEVVFHGTTSNFEKFDPSRANIEADWGKGLYFSNNPEDVGFNYAGIGPDLDSKIEQHHDRLDSAYDYDPATKRDVDEFAQEHGHDVENDRRNTMLAFAKQKLGVEHGGVTRPAYLSMKKPAVFGGDDETVLRMEREFPPLSDYDPAEVRQWRKEGYSGDALKEILASEHGYDWTEKGSLPEFIDALRSVASRFDDTDNIEEAIQEIVDQSNYEEISLREAIDIVKNHEGAITYATDDNGDLAAHEILRQALERAGYDGIIDHMVDVKFGSQRKFGQSMKGMHPDTTHYIAFHPDQVKDAITATPVKTPKKK